MTDPVAPSATARRRAAEVVAGSKMGKWDLIKATRKAR
jgi:hypothetical protein